MLNVSVGQEQGADLLAVFKESLSVLVEEFMFTPTIFFQFHHLLIYPASLD